MGGRVWVPPLEEEEDPEEELLLEELELLEEAVTGSHLRN
jgi:hypothetical protein